MPISSAALAVNTTAVLVASGAAGRDPLVRVVVKGAASNDVYFGGADVTTANGLPLLTTDTNSITFELGPGDALYAIASGAATVRVLRTRQ